MTSTPFNVGLTDNTRLSSRVLRPPGGGHTDIFGGEPEPPRGRRAGPPQQASQIGQGDIPKPTNGTEAPATSPAPVQNGQDHPSPAPQEPKPEPPKQDSPIAKQESPITPEPVEKPKVDIPKPSLALGPQEPVKAEPAKRVRVPPGGFSSGLW